MLKIGKRTVALLALLVLGGCATLPTGPSVMVLPGAGKPFEEFQADDVTCRQWASQSIGTAPQEVANQNTASGAAIGAGSGLLVGTAEGANAGQAAGRDAQRRYDYAYMQCMHAKGNQIPRDRGPRHYRVVAPPPPPVYYAPY